MNILEKAWSWFDGAKTYIGVFLAVIYAGLLSQGLIEQNASVELFILSVFGVGVGHKAVKKLG